MSVRKKVVSLLLAGVLAVSASGCGIVKVIPKGTEADYTGEQKIDTSATAGEDWKAVQEDVIAKAQDLSEIKPENGKSYAVKFTGKVDEYNTDSPKGYLAVTVEDVSDSIRVATGKVISGTAIRDSQSVKEFKNFTNQTEWSAYAKDLNQQALENVISANQIGADTVGKTIEVVGCFTTASNKTITVVPVSIKVQ
jgi:predicted lipoprotein